MRKIHVPVLLLLITACGDKSPRSADPVPDAQAACAAKPDSEWKDGVCLTRVPGPTQPEDPTKPTEEQVCEKDPTKEWKDGSCQTKETEPPRYTLAQSELAGIWIYKGCSFTSLDGGSWQVVTWNVGAQGPFVLETLLFPSSKCEFYKSRVTQQGQFTFDEASQNIKLQFTSCKYNRVTSTEEQECKELTKEQTFEIFGESPTRLTMNTFEFNKN